MAQHPFLWGAATSAHQVEGNNIHNDWWQWERQQSDRIQSGLASDHYRRFREDFILARELGHTAHRFSIEWSRLEPAPGQWNERAMVHYREVLQELRRQGLVPVVTLHHFTLPVWAAAAGGWENPQTIAAFVRYTERVAEQLGELAQMWITINEPVVYVLEAYWHKRWPPQQRSIRRMWRVFRNLAQAHRLSYLALHKRRPGARVGVAKHWLAVKPARPTRRTDRVAAIVTDWGFNRFFYRLTRGTHDFIGVNYYQAVERRWDIWPWRWIAAVWDGLRSELEWPIRPEGLEQVLLSLRAWRLPIYVTENGVADASDQLRPDFIREHLRAVERAQAAGADVRGYFHWSLLDNFEWAEGFTPRFGLVAVDFATQARRPRPSAYVLRAIIEAAQRR